MCDTENDALTCDLTRVKSSPLRLTCLLAEGADRPGQASNSPNHPQMEWEATATGAFVLSIVNLN